MEGELEKEETGNDVRAEERASDEGEDVWV